MPNEVPEQTNPLAESTRGVSMIGSRSSGGGSVVMVWAPIVDRVSGVSTQLVVLTRSMGER